MWDTRKYSVDEVMAEIVMVVDEAIRSYLVDSDRNDVVLIFDCEGISFDKARHGTPTRVFQALDLFMV